MKTFIKIYGERNTGTNYLSKLIELNLEAEQLPSVAPQNILKLQRLFPGREWIRDLYFHMSFNNNLGWKHCQVNHEKIKASRLYQKNRIAIITLSKNPYSWLLSLYRNPYHQHYTNKPDFKTFLQQPWKTVARDNIKTSLDNPIQLWNMKNASYLQTDFLNLRSENLIGDPQTEVDRISTQFAIKKCTTDFINYEQSTKDSNKNNQYYQDYYQKEKWREQLDAEAIEIINYSIDKNLLRSFGYTLLHSSLE